MPSQWDEYADFEAEANRDTRLGDHDFLVESVVEDTWPSGDPRIKVKGALTTAGDAVSDLTWSPPPAKAVLDQQKGSMEKGKARAIANAIAIARALETHYGKQVKDLKPGDLLRVKTVKTKPDANGRYFVRVGMILPMGAPSNNRAPF